MFGSSKKKVAQGNNWRKAERELAGHPVFDGYDVQTQKPFRSVKKRPDIFATNPEDNRDRMVGDAKCVSTLQKQHVDQVVGYKGHPGYAKKGVVGVAKDTHVPRDVLHYAKDRNVKIVRLNVKREQNLVERYILDD